MSKDIVRRDRPPLSGLHPYVYGAIAALALWFVLSAWSFASDGYADWLLAVVSAFLLIRLPPDLCRATVRAVAGVPERGQGFDGF